jgi:hypothetical protein
VAVMLFQWSSSDCVRGELTHPMGSMTESAEFTEWFPPHPGG